MKTIQEQIKVMKRFSYGEIVEAYGYNLKEWTIINEPSWNWLKYDYRIKVEVVSIEKWLIKHRRTERVEIIEGNNKFFEAYNSKYEKIKLIEKYEVEL